MATTRTTIVNGALIRLGSSQRITDIDQGDPLSIQCADVWAGTTDYVLEAHPWNFAVTRARVERDGDFSAETAGYAYRFRLPNDCLRWLPADPGDADYFLAEQEGEFLHSHEGGPVIIRFIKRVDDISRWSASFIEAVTFRLAYVLAPTVSASVSQQDRMLQAFEDALSAARGRDGLATGRVRRPDYARHSRLVQSRHRHCGGC